MAASEAVLDATATAAVVDDNTLNPTTTNLQRTVVHVSLIFDGIDFVPNDIFDAIDAEWGTVESMKSSPSHNIYEFKVSA